MKWLPLLVYILSAPTIAGIIMIILLSMGNIPTKTLITATLAGFVVALPVAWFVTRAIRNAIKA